MRLFPQDTRGRLDFFVTHNPIWAERASAIGSSPQAIANLADKTEAARLAYKRQQEAQQFAQAATQELNRLMDDLLKAGADVVKEIRSRAAIDGQSVYHLALIPPPRQPSPIPAPGTPGQITAELRTTGELLLKWKCRNPRGSVGTVYQISRAARAARAPGDAGVEGPMIVLATVGKKKFLDETVPVGASSITYAIRAFRSTRSGQAAYVTVNLGVSNSNLTKFQPRSAAA